MLPSRTTLTGWNADSLITSAAAINSAAGKVSGAVKQINQACQQMPEMKSWSGRAHDAAAAMFTRADRDASKFSDYAAAVASALSGGAESIGSARRTLLAKADEVDAGPLNVTDQWVVLIDPVMTSEDELAKLKARAQDEQGVINRILTTVGDADDSTANAVVAAGNKFGFVEAGPPTDLGGLMLPTPQRPPDQVPDPRTPVGMVSQEAIRAADEQQKVREVIESTNENGEAVTTVIKQDGSKSVKTRMDPFEWPTKQSFYQIEEFDKNGKFVARTSSWHDLTNDVDYTSITYADNSNLLMSMDSTGCRNAGFTTADGRHSQVPVDLIDRMSMATGAGMSGLEKHIARGGSLPMVTAESLENVGKTMKYGGPALAAATTVFDMMMADTPKERCVALVSGVAGGGGGWGMAEAGAAVGLTTGPFAPVGVPLFAVIGGGIGAFGGAEMGKFVGEVVCPY